MRILDKIKSFRREQSGFATLELTILMPMLFVALFGTYSFFDLFFNYNKSIKATQAVADIISRQTEVDNAYLEKLHNVYRAISQTRADETSWMRVTAVTNNSPTDIVQDIEVNWSHVMGSRTNTYSTGDEGINGFIPTLLAGQSVIIVETSRDAKPIFSWDPFVSGETREFPNSMTFPLRFSTDLANTDYPPESSLGSGGAGDGGTGS